MDELLGIAGELKYVKGVKDEIHQELTEPSDWLVKEMAQRVHSSKRITLQILDSFRPIVARAIQSCIADRINETLDKASKTVEAKEHDHESDEQDTIEAENSNNIITTQEEIDALYIVQSHLRPILSIQTGSWRKIRKPTVTLPWMVKPGNPS